MTVTDPAALGSLPFVREDLGSLLSARTLEILERRGKTGIKRRGWLVRRALLSADLVGLSLAFVLTELAFGFRSGGTFNRPAEALLFVCVLPVWVLAAKIYGLYERDEERTDHTTTDDFGGVFHMVTMGVWFVVALAWTTGFAHLQRHKILLFWLVAVVAVVGCRAIARAICRRDILYLQNTIVLGNGDVGRHLARKLLKHPEYGLNLVGFVDSAASPPEVDDSVLANIAFLGTPGSLKSLVSLLDVDRVIVASPALANDEVLGLIRELSAADVQVDLLPSLYQVVTPGLNIHTVEGLPVIGLPPPRLSRSTRLVKRGFDVLVASAALGVLAPLFPWVAWRIKQDSPGPLFFLQERMGADERPFRILKFRTMIVDAEARKHELNEHNVYTRNGEKGRMFKVTDDPRVTPFGRFLRRYFLDELPQLVNVLRGEMSIVGPRPLVLDEDMHVDDWRRRRLSLKPGMTGSWQVLGRNEIGFEEMLGLDYLYVTNWSLWGDMRLVCKTIPIVFRGGGGTL